MNGSLLGAADTPETATVAATTETPTPTSAAVTDIISPCFASARPVTLADQALGARNIQTLAPQHAAPSYRGMLGIGRTKFSLFVPPSRLTMVNGECLISRMWTCRHGFPTGAAAGKIDS